MCLGRVGQITESLFKPCQKVLGNLDFSCIVNFHLPHTCNVAFSVRKRGLKCKVHGETFFKFYFDLKAIWCFFSFCSRGNCQFDRPCQVERSECFAKLNGKQYYCIGGERQLALKRKQYTVLNSWKQIELLFKIYPKMVQVFRYYVLIPFYDLGLSCIVLMKLKKVLGKRQSNQRGLN